MDDYLAEFWQEVFPAISPHPDLTLRTGGTIAAAIRKDSPKLKAADDAWIRSHGPRTAFGNVLDKRSLQSTTYARRATSESDRQKCMELVTLFEEYAGQYDLDFVLMGAQAYQESGLDQGMQSRVGALGIMQVMPRTGEE